MAVNCIEKTSSALSDLDKLAEFIADMSYEQIDQKTINQGIKVFFDTFGVMIRGSQEPEMQKFTKSLAGTDRSAATLLTDGFPSTNYLWAAISNGTEGIFMELDEGHRPTGHPAIHIIPSALAVAEAENRSGRDLLLAIILGYEVTARISWATKLKTGIHPHGHMGIVGAAVACGKLKGFNKTKIKEVMNVAATLPLHTTWEPCFEGATVRNAFTGISNAIGLVSAEMVDSGFTGLDEGVSYTFGELLGKSFDSSWLSKDLGKEFQILSNYFKFHACCVANHPALDALQEIQKQYPDLNTNDIEQINVFVTDYSMVVNKYPARNQLSAKFSLPCAVATTLYHGKALVEAFQNDKVKIPEICTIAEKVLVQADPVLTKRWPTDVGAIVEIVQKDGKVLRGTCSNAYGYWQNPCSTRDLINKFCSLTDPVFKVTEVEQVYQLFETLPKRETVQSFIEDLKKFNQK
jgi:2-methylcitrate dehydratase PrpD